MGAPRIDRLEKNYIINGNFDFWQRGVSSSTNGYLADRFSFQNVTSAGTYTRTRSTDVPSFLESGYRSLYSDLITVGTADASLVGDERAFYSQIIEGFNMQNLIGKKVTLSFWVKCSKTGTQSVAFNNGSGTGGAGFISYVATYTINAANTWERKVITLTIDSTGPWGAGNSYGLSLAWSLGTSLTNQFATGTANQWITAPSPSAKYHFTGNLNLFDTAAATWRIAQIQLVEGENLDPVFAPAGRNYEEEFQLCKRYYETGTHRDGASQASGAIGALGAIQFKVEKRAVPAMQSFGNGSPGQFRNDNTGATEGTASFGPTTTGSGVGSTTGLSSNISYSMVWTADAEL